MLRFTDNIIAQMTLDCNLRCKYCYECHQEKWKGKFFTVEQFKEALDTVLYERCILGHIENKVEWHFHGGEVFMLPWSDIKQMIDYLEKRKKFFPGLTYSFQSNGTLITDEMAEYFAKKNIDIGISFDGFNDSERMSPKANQKFFERISYLHNRYGLHFGVLTVFSKKNMKEWESDARKILKVVDQIGINLLCANDSNIQDVPTGDEVYQYWFEPVLKSYCTKSPIKERDMTLEIERAVTDIVFNSISYSTSKTGCFDRVCGIYSNMTALNPDLTLHPCDKFLENGAYVNLRKSQSLSQRDFLGLQTAKAAISHYDKIFKEELKLGCDSCEARLVCPGECQSYNLSNIGKVKIEDTYCKIMKKAYHFVEDHILEILLNNKIYIEDDVNSVKSSFLRKVNEANLKVCFDNQSKLLYLERNN